MKKLIVVGLVGTAIIGGVVLAKGASAASTPEGKACTRMASLCSTEEKSAKDLDRCVDDMKATRKLAGDVAFERSTKCLDEANSCAAASGCWVGGVGVGALGEAMKGFGTALSK
ncbi:MAG TPA: hypothetical protein VM925_30965 [Labilithrix sp.]|nr:hypothetical protein [Labilithrix sp.]